MWTRKELKEQSKQGLKRNYWKAVLVSILFSTLIAGTYCTSSTVTAPDQSGEIEAATAEIQQSISAFSTTEIMGALIALLGIMMIALICVFVTKVIILNPLRVGIYQFRKNAVDGQGNISDLGRGFDVRYKRNVKTMLCRNLFVFFWSLLFIIPGIIKSYEYSMIPYILAEDPDIDMKGAFAQSKQLMKGNKWKAFVLDLSFILWGILSVLTFGAVYVLYVNPYKQLTDAALYNALKKNN